MKSPPPGGSAASVGRRSVALEPRGEPAGPGPVADPAGAGPARAELPRPTVLLLVLAISLFHLLTFREGHLWGDDFAMYVLHARNLLEGRAYADTGYLYNPLAPWYSPPSYPPGFPVLLAPVYLLFGLDIAAMKAVVLLFFSGALLLLARLFRGELPHVLVLAGIVVVGLNPFLWEFKNQILPDLPFLFFVLLSLEFARRFFDDSAPVRRRIAWGVAAGLAMYAATATRTIGITLVASLVAAHLVFRKRPGWGSAVCVTVFLLLYRVQSVLLPADSGYAAQIEDVVDTYGLAEVLPRLDIVERAYWAVLELWTVEGLPIAGEMLCIALTLMAVAGFFLRLRKRSIVESFAAGYTAAVLLWGVMATRYLIPVIPLYVFYVLVTLAWMARRWPGVARAAGVVLLLGVGGSYLSRYASADYGAYEAPRAATAPEVQDLFRFVRARTSPDDVILFHKPRALTLYTGRPAGVPPATGRDARMLSFLRENRVAYVILPTEPGAMSALASTMGRHPAAFRLTFTNPGFRVFRVVARRPSRSPGPGL